MLSLNRVELPDRARSRCLSLRGLRSGSLFSHGRLLPFLPGSRFELFTGLQSTRIHSTPLFDHRPSLRALVWPRLLSNESLGWLSAFFRLWLPGLSLGTLLLRLSGGLLPCSFLLRALHLILRRRPLLLN